MADLGEFKEEPDEYDVASNYGLDKRLFIAILKVESGLDHKAINPSTMDFGIGQINYKTAEAYQMDTVRLIKDRAYSIEKAALVLSDFKRKFHDSEPDTWACRYNVGWGRLEGRRAYQCEIYLRKIRVAMGDF
ncbi:MAG: transglycosylase SLT domain-containing protein [Candidatus Paceibacterota bacterium]